MGGGAEGEEIKLESSYPANSSTWAISFRGAFREFADPSGTAQPYVICAEEPPGYTIEGGDGPFPCTDHCSASMGCINQVMLSAGMSGSTAELETSAATSEQSWTVTWYADKEDFGPDAVGVATTYSICADAPDNFALETGIAQSCVGADAPCTTTEPCPPNTVPFSGGIIGNQEKTGSLFPTELGWVVSWFPASYEFPDPVGQASAVVLCGSGTITRETIFSSGFDA